MPFLANFPGRCGNCGELFAPGDEIFYDAGDTLLGQDCCGESDETAAGREPKALEPVMPRGRSVADRCGVCFQIPSSNGLCGCNG